MSTQAPKQGNLLVILTVTVGANLQGIFSFQLIPFKQSSELQGKKQVCTDTTTQAHLSVHLYVYIPLSVCTNVDLVEEKGVRTRKV